MTETNNVSNVQRLLNTMKTLRGPNGCSWDKAQTIQSLRPFLVEECYEVLDEMDALANEKAPNWNNLRDELGDLLFQIVFHAQLAEELGHFTFDQIAQSIADKLIRRHPQVFAEAEHATPKRESKPGNWEELKSKERLNKNGSRGSVLDGVPNAAPGLLRAERLTEKASRIGFDWQHVKEVREKVSEELAELDAAIAANDSNEIENELGDVLFALTNLGRHLKTPPEDALRKTILRFTKRFHHVEKRVDEIGLGFGQASIDQMNEFWAEAKAIEQQSKRGA
jgi:nucleoside triphosphate diphosphatase